MKRGNPVGFRAFCKAKVPVPEKLPRMGLCKFPECKNRCSREPKTSLWEGGEPRSGGRSKKTWWVTPSVTLASSRDTSPKGGGQVTTPRQVFTPRDESTSQKSLPQRGRWRRSRRMRRANIRFVSVFSRVGCSPISSSTTCGGPPSPLGKA